MIERGSARTALDARDGPAPLVTPAMTSRHTVTDRHAAAELPEAGVTARREPDLRGDDRPGSCRFLICGRDDRGGTFRVAAPAQE